MDIRQLRYFVEIVEQGSLTRAAEKLDLVQPALGLQVRKLEQELGTQLLHRHSRGVEPTEAGLLMLQYGREIIASMKQAKQAIEDFSGPPRGSISFGISPSISLKIAAPLIQHCRDEMPLVKLSLVEGLSNLLESRVAGKDLDMALAYAEPGHRHLKAEALAREPLYFIQPRGAHGPIDTAATLDEVLRSPLVLPGHRHALRHLMETAAESEGLELKLVAEVHSPLSMRSLVEAGVGASVLPRTVIGQYSTDRISVRKIASSRLMRTLTLLYRDTPPLPKSHKHVRALVHRTLTDVFREQPDLDLLI